MVGFPVAKCLNETIAVDLNHWSDSLKVWFLHIIDHVTQYSASFVVRSKNKVILEKIFKQWVAIFCSPKKILVDNAGEFANSNFITFCENFNIRKPKVVGATGSLNGIMQYKSPKFSMRKFHEGRVFGKTEKGH